MWEKDLFGLWFCEYQYNLYNRSLSGKLRNSKLTLKLWFSESSIYQNVKFAVKLPMSGKRKLNFLKVLIIIKVNMELSERTLRKFITSCFTLTIASMAIATLKIRILQLLSNAEHRLHWRKEKPFNKIDLKPFTQQV